MIVVSPYRNVYENLAFEDLLFDSYDGKEQHLLLYVDEPAVILGRFQNPWREMDLRLIQERGVLAARRISGGGCVYHDGGNLNFSVFLPREDFSRSETVAVVIRVLEELGIHAESNCRHDILVDGNKVSGSAYRLVRSKAYHHGTLLVNASLDMVGEFLSPTYPGIESGGTASVSSPVANLSDSRPGLTVDTLISAFVSTDIFGQTGNASGIRIPDTARVTQRAEELASPLWIFGKTPAFSITREDREYRFPKGQLPGNDGWSLSFKNIEKI